jgi:nucleoside-diphosphate-sugar epimerase
MKKILLTGGHGFIGHNIVRKLEDSEYTPIIYDSRSDYDGLIDNEELFTLNQLRKQQFSTNVIDYNKDILDDLFLNSTIKEHQPEIIIHLAAFPRAKVVLHNPQLGCDVILKGILNLLESARKNNVQRFVYISSSMIYGDFDSNPNLETASKNPIEPYGIMKLAGESLVKNYNRIYGLEYTIVRPSAVYGPRDVVDRVLSKFVVRAKNGDPMRINGAGLKLDFSVVDEIADGIILAATKLGGVNETFNITRGLERPLYEAANIINDILGTKTPVIVEENDGKYPKRGALDITKARTLLGFDPKVNIEEGLKYYIDSL